jgi:hypothetical protein
MIMGPWRPIGGWIKVKNLLGAGEPATDRSSSDIGFEKSAEKMTLAPIEQAERHVAEGERRIPKQRPYRFTHENEYRSPGARFTEPLAVSPAIAFLPRSKGVSRVYRVDVAAEQKMEDEGEGHTSSN